jgi:hypothetical protein
MSKKKTLPLSGMSKDIAVLALGVMMAVTLWAGVLAPPSARADDVVTLSVATEAAYTPSEVDAILPNRDLALFRARRKAAEQAADQFVLRRLIQFADRDRDELVLLVADQLAGEVRENCCRPNGDHVTCTVRLHAVVRLSDFIDAQLTSLQLTRDEAHAGYREEMAPPVPRTLKPGHLLAKAYHLIDRQQTRLAIIYLDNLTRRYPTWRELYEVKAMALQMQNRPAEAAAVLRKACEVGKKE